MELVAYIRLFRKWFWLLFLGAFLAGGAAFLIRSRQPDQYTASVTIQVGSSLETPNPQLGELNTGAQLARTYAVLAKSVSVLERAVEAREFPFSVDELGRSLSAEVIENTSLLRLTVTYTDPVLAAEMANEVANQLILNSPSNLTPEQQAQIDLANQEIAQLTAELQQARDELSDIDQEIREEQNPDVLADLRQQRNTIADRIVSISANIAQYSDTIAGLQRRTNSLTVVEEARIPTSPTGSNIISTTLLGAIVGGALAAGIALLIEYLDDTIRSADEATQILGLPTLAVINRFGKTRDSYSERLITLRDPGSPISEQYRTLRTNLLFSSNGGWTKAAYVITSPGPSEGKSVTTANLAVTMAMAGLRVLLIDADLRRPRLHEIFNLPNNVGLSTLLSTDPSQLPSDITRGTTPQNLLDCLQDTEVPGLRVITSGFLPLNPTEVLGSVAMQHWFEIFKTSKNVDIVLFDTPPCLVVADSAVLSAAIKAPVVLVLSAGETRRAAAVRTREQMDQIGIEMKGVVLNSVSSREQDYAYGGGYYYYYYSSDHATRETKEE
jgi:succinoglycan biosynthesis transport protein ExoP